MFQKGHFLKALFVVLALLVVTLPAAQATLRRVPGSWMWGPRPVWTDGTANPMFHPFSDPIDAGTVTNARVSIEMDQDTGNCKIRPALRYSDDGISWNSAVAIISTYRDTAGADYGSTYVDLTGLTTPRTWVQFGIQAANQSGSAIEFCNATLLVQPKDKP